MYGQRENHSGKYRPGMCSKYNFSNCHATFHCYMAEYYGYCTSSILHDNWIARKKASYYGGNILHRSQEEFKYIFVHVVYILSFDISSY